MTDDLVGRGLPMFLPKGIYRMAGTENYIKKRAEKLEFPCYDSCV